MDSAAGWVVVDGCSLGICGSCDAGLTNVGSVCIIKVEDESAWEAHRLDRDELVGDEATEDSANDRECDVREALDLAG